MKISSIRGSQSGVVSIVITTFVLLIMGLIVVGFGQMVRREQRQTLDRQLSTQAQYAAESGLNSAIKFLSDPANAAYAGKGDCGVDGDFPNNDVGPNSKYPCLIIKPEVSALEYGAVSTDQSEFVLLKNSSGAPIKTIEISWEIKDTAATPSFGPRPSPPFLPASGPGGWGNNTGVLRTEVIPIPTPLSRDNLIANQRVYFLYPTSGGASTINYPSDGDAIIKDAQCAVGGLPNDCKVNVDLGASAKPEVFLRLKSFYTSSKVTVKALDAAGNPVVFVGAQAVVDVTGQAKDVLRRIQVNVDLTQDPLVPEGVLETLDSVCKRLLVGPPVGATPGFGDTDTPSEPACAIP